MSVQAIDRIQPLWTDLQTEGMRLDAGAEVGGTRRTQPTLFSFLFGYMDRFFISAAA